MKGSLIWPFTGVCLPIVTQCNKPFHGKPQGYFSWFRIRFCHGCKRHPQSGCRRWSPHEPKGCNHRIRPKSYPVFKKILSLLPFKVNRAKSCG